LYNKRTTSDGKSCWRCVTRSCPSRGEVQDDDEAFVLIGVHNHDDDSKKITRLKFNNVILREAETTIKKNITILTEATTTMVEYELKTLPKYKNLHDKITKKRKMQSKYYENCLEDIPPFLKLDMQNNTFLRLTAELMIQIDILFSSLSTLKNTYQN
jgi:hypothetical protein